MRVFVTGATGFIGSAVVRDLIDGGHRVLGLCRSDAKAAALAAAGADVLRGSTGDPVCLREGASVSDGVIHLAFNHDFTKFRENCEEDRRVILTLGAALAGTGHPLIVTSGTGIVGTEPGRAATETDTVPEGGAIPRAASEEAAAAVAAEGGVVSVVRLPQVHDPVRQGLVSYAIAIFREQGRCAYVGDGLNRWPAAHVSDVARLYRLALERAQPGATYHAVAEEGVIFRDIVETVGQRLDLPVVSIGEEEAQAFFGWLAMFAGHDLPASGAWTRATLGWTPTGPGLIADLDALMPEDL